MHRRVINSLIEPQFSSESAGVRWYRAAAALSRSEMDPFIRLDHFTNAEQLENYAVQPEKTYSRVNLLILMLHGKLHYRYDRQHKGQVLPGGALWLHAAEGIEFEEVYEPVRGRFEGFRLWIDHPTDQDQDPPAVLSIPAGELPSHREENGVFQRVLLGSCGRQNGRLFTSSTAVSLCDITVPANASFTAHLPQANTVLAYIYQGRGFFGSYAEEDDLLIPRQKFLLFGQGDYLSVRTEETPLHFLLGSGMRISGSSSAAETLQKEAG